MGHPVCASKLQMSFFQFQDSVSFGVDQQLPGDLRVQAWRRGTICKQFFRCIPHSVGWTVNRRFFGKSTFNTDLPFFGPFLITLVEIEMSRYHVLLG